MRIAWHGREGALHFLLMDEPVVSRRAVSADIILLLDKDGRPVRVDALRLAAVPGVAYDAREDLLDFHLREGEARRRVHVLPGMVAWLGPEGEALSIHLLAARQEWHVPLEDIVLLEPRAVKVGGGNLTTSAAFSTDRR